MSDTNDILSELDVIIGSIQRTKDSSEALRRYSRLREKLAAALPADAPKREPLEVYEIRLREVASVHFNGRDQDAMLVAADVLRLVATARQAYHDLHHPGRELTDKEERTLSAACQEALHKVLKGE